MDKSDINKIVAAILAGHQAAASGSSQHTGKYIRAYEDILKSIEEKIENPKHTELENDIEDPFADD